MANGGNWTAGKVVMVVGAVLAGLAIVCCGVGYFLVGDKVKAGIAFGTHMAAFEMRIQKEFGPKAIATVQQDDQMEFILLVGVPGELTPEKVASTQDTAWKALSETFGSDGFLPVTHVAVGHPARRSGSQAGVRDWAKNKIAVDELVKRTGVAAPPLVKFLPAEFAQGHAKAMDDEDAGDGDEKDGGGEEKKGDAEPKEPKEEGGGVDGK